MCPQKFDSIEYFSKPGRKQLEELSRRVDIEGYEYVVLRPNGKSGRKYFPVHILIAEKMLGYKIPEGMVVHHINGDRLDNRPENLQILSAGEHIKLHHQIKKSEKESAMLEAKKV